MSFSILDMEKGLAAEEDGLVWWERERDLYVEFLWVYSLESAGKEVKKVDKKVGGGSGS